MKALILAAGRGSRMGTLTEAMPKCMTVLAGKRLIDWQLEALRGAGIDKIGIVRGYKAEVLAFADVETFENPRWFETNMVMSLMQAAPWMRDDVCIVSYSDIVYPSAIVAKLMTAEAPISIAYDLNWLTLWQERFANPLSDAETFRLSDQSRLVEIGNKPNNLAEVQGQYMGLLRFTPAGWETVDRYLQTLPRSVKDKLDMTTLLRSLLQEKIEIRAVPIRDPWFEIDSESDLRRYEERLALTGGRPW
jgi:choline kinase